MYKLKVRNEVSENSGAVSGSYDLYIYSGIEKDSAGFGVSARSLVNQLEEAEAVNNITLHINSEGGDLFEGLAIYNYLKELKDTGTEINVIIEGMCASSASVAAMAGSKISMYENSYVMIHNPEGSASGSSEEFAKYAEILEDLSSQIINIYASRTSLSVETVKDLMNKESWMNAETCRTLGFCDEIIKSESQDKTENIQVEDKAEIQVTNMYRPLNREREKFDSDIKFMAECINQRRGR